MYNALALPRRQDDRWLQCKGHTKNRMSMQSAQDIDMDMRRILSIAMVLIRAYLCLKVHGVDVQQLTKNVAPRCQQRRCLFLKRCVYAWTYATTMLTMNCEICLAHFR